MEKDDRAHYYNPQADNWQHYEFNKGANHHLFRWKDLDKGHVYSFDNGYEGFEKLLRSRLPIPIYASDHIIWGDLGDEFTGMKIIRFFDNYRPLLVPEVWWFVYREEKEWRNEVAGGRGMEE